MGVYRLGLLSVQPGGDVDQVHLAVQQLGEGDAVGLGQAALDLLAAGHAVLDEKALPAALADPVHHHQWETHPAI